MNSLVGIAESTVFICLINDRFEGSSGEDHLAFAISLKKPVFLWRTPEHAHLPIPDVLEGYEDLHIVDGDHDVVIERVREYFEIVPGTSVDISTHRY